MKKKIGIAIGLVVAVGLLGNPIMLRQGSADIQHLDDVIITGSLCVGFDCVNNEIFGFDTLRLKENNLRIKFEDTSNSASFPTQDWQLTANATTNGGGNFFSIDAISPTSSTPFKVETAPNNSFFLRSNGHLGLGTGAPVVDVHVVSGNTPTLRLDQNGSDGFTPQVWDVAGNEANFFIRDATNGSKLPFRITPNTPSNTIRMFTDHIAINDGAADYDTQIKGNTAANANLFYADAGNARIGIGTGSPDDELDVESSEATADIRLTSTATTTASWRIRANSGQASLVFQHAPTNSSSFKIFENAGNNRLVVAANGAVGINTETPNAGAALDVNGPIFLRGAVLHADYVFAPEYKLESIEDHAKSMWTNKHLPAISKRTVNEQGQEVVELGADRRGIVEELEKAHIYIAQLKEQLGEKETKLDKFSARLEKLESLLESSAK